MQHEIASYSTVVGKVNEQHGNKARAEIFLTKKKKNYWKKIEDSV